MFNQNTEYTVYSLCLSVFPSLKLTKAIKIIPSKKFIALMNELKLFWNEEAMEVRE